MRAESATPPSPPPAPADSTLPVPSTPSSQVLASVPLPTITTTPSQSRPPTPSTKRLTSASLRAEMLGDQSSLYLGRPDLAELVEWHRDGLKDVLVLRTPNESGSTSSGDGDEDDDGAPVVTPAILSVIGQVSSEKCYVGPSGDYHPESKFGDKGLQAAKASFLLQKITLGRLADLWGDYQANIVKVQSSAPDVFPQQKGFFEPTRSGGSLRMTHCLFEDVSGDPGAMLFHPGREETESWPIGKRFKRKMEDLLEAGCYIVRPLVVLDPSNQPVPITSLEKEFRGSVLESHFSLQHWRYPNSKESVFVAVMVESRIRRSATHVSPAKRSVSLRDSGPAQVGDGSPVKRLRVA